MRLFCHGAIFIYITWHEKFKWFPPIATREFSFLPLTSSCSTSSCLFFPFSSSTFLIVCVFVFILERIETSPLKVWKLYDKLMNMFLILTLQYAVEATCIEIGQVVSLYCEFAFIRWTLIFVVLAGVIKPRKLMWKKRTFEYVLKPLIQENHKCALINRNSANSNSSGRFIRFYIDFICSTDNCFS